MNIFTPQQTETAIVAPNGKPMAATPAKKKRDWSREPNYRLSTPGFEEIEGGIWVTDAQSNNAGSLYFDVSRCNTQGKRFKTLRLHQDFFGAATAMTEIAGLAAKDPAITDEQRGRYEVYRAEVSKLLIRLLLPNKFAAHQDQPQTPSELAALFS